MPSKAELSRREVITFKPKPPLEYADYPESRFLCDGANTCMPFCLNVYFQQQLFDGGLDEFFRIQKPNLTAKHFSTEVYDDDDDESRLNLTLAVTIGTRFD